jgi:CheY-like chemotaxis protein
MQHRFDEVSVIICDYQMPSMKGTDFFAALGDIPQKRILLTGEADESVAVKAFNDGVIDKFLTKGRSGVARELFGGIIARFQRDYFKYQNSFASSIVTLSDSIFSHPGFDALVQTLYQKYGFIEHYYINFPDGALLVDEGPLRKRLVAFTEVDYEGILAVLT